MSDQKQLPNSFINKIILFSSSISNFLSKNVWNKIPNIFKTKKFIIASSISLIAFCLLKKYFNGSKCNVNNNNLNDKVVIITGANTGIGAVTAREIAQRGATVVLACRDENRTKPLLNELALKKYKVCFMQLDLADLNSIKKFTDEFKAQFNRLDILINNAGIMALPTKQSTVQGFEMQLGVNYIGHFYLTSLLKDILKKTEQSRVINVSSKAHKKMFQAVGHIHFEDINFDKSQYDPYVAYAQSKLANILYTKQLQLQFDKENQNTKVVSLHPGVVRTELGRYMLSEKIFLKIITFALYPIYYLLTKSSYYGAQTTLYCALEQYENLVKGGYYSDCKIATSSIESNDMHVAQQLMYKTYQMIEQIQNK